MTERLHFHFSLSCIGEGNGNPLQCYCLENSRDGGAWWAAVCGVSQSHTWLKWLSSSSSSAPVRVECDDAAPAWLVKTLAAPNVKGHGLPPLQELWPMRIFFPASCNWWSEGLFGQSFSTVLSLQALRGLPCFRSFSVVQYIRHIEGPPWLGSYSRSACQSLKGTPWVGYCSVVQFIRHLMGQPVYFSAADAGLWGERAYGDGSTRYVWLSGIALLPWLSGFPSQAFHTTVFSLTSPWSVSPQSTAALAVGLRHDP